MIIRKDATFETLKDIYEVMRRHIKDSDCFLSQDELTELKENPENIFLSGGHHNAERI